MSLVQDSLFGLVTAPAHAGVKNNGTLNEPWLPCLTWMETIPVLFQVFLLVDRIEANTRHMVWMGMIEQFKFVDYCEAPDVAKWMVQGYIQHIAYNWLIVGYDLFFPT